MNSPDDCQNPFPICTQILDEDEEATSAGGVSILAAT